MSPAKSKIRKSPENKQSQNKRRHQGIFPRNISGHERLIRLVVGVILVAISFSGYVDANQEFWLVVLGWLGITSGIIGHCPVYGLLGKSTYGK